LLIDLFIIVSVLRSSSTIQYWCASLRDPKIVQDDVECIIERERETWKLNIVRAGLSLSTPITMYSEISLVHLHR